MRQRPRRADEWLEVRTSCSLDAKLSMKADELQIGQWQLKGLEILHQ